MKKLFFTLALSFGFCGVSFAGLSEDNYPVKSSYTEVATTGWVVDCHDVTTPASFITEQTGGTTATATVTNYSRTTGLAIAWTASDILRCAARAY